MKPRVIVIITLMFMLVGGAGVALYVRSTMPSVTVSEAVVRKAGFSVVVPATLPDGLKMTTEPYYDAEAAVVTTRFETDNGDEIVTSQQARPAESLDQIDSQDRYLVNVGSVYVLKGEPGRLQAIVVTTDSWILINASGAVNAAEFKRFTETLTEA